MLRHIVKNYSIIAPLGESNLKAQGDSASPKGMIFHILEDNSTEVDVLDIGFGVGGLGELIKNNPQTAHWSVDGVDGLEANCSNQALFEKNIYRNIWHGFAQEIPSEQFKKYKIICLLDIIEHLTVDTAKWLLRALLTYMDDNASLFISTPLWFYPQDSQQNGDLEEHLTGCPKTP